MVQSNEDAQVNSVQDALLRSFHGRVPDDRICAEVESTRESFRGARIRTYIPVLIMHEAAGRLRKLREPQAA
jgi:hypothetical protein